MRRIGLWLAALLLPLTVLVATQAPAQAACSSGCGHVSSTEFWEAWGGTTASSFENQVGAQAFAVDNMGGGEYARHYYANTPTYTRNVVQIVVHTEWNGTNNIIQNSGAGDVWFAVYGSGGKAQGTSDGSFYTYPVNCTGAPC